MVPKSRGWLGQEVYRERFAQGVLWSSVQKGDGLALMGMISWEYRGGREDARLMKVSLKESSLHARNLHLATTLYTATAFQF